MTPDTERLLREGTLTLEGRLVYASNASFLGAVALEGVTARCVYKPTAGERPLDDFPDGTLAHREVAAYLVSEASGWGVAPPTVLRDEGPHGPGMAQLWIDVDETVDVAELLTAGDERLRRIAAFDAVVNNTDRKGGHLLPTPGGRILGVDHGVCFSTYPKLRTILWGWRGEPFAEDELAALRTIRAALDGDLGRALRSLLSRPEVRATIARVDRLLANGTYPFPSPGWPAVPWPPF
ncbi:MAG: phosphatidylinositol kinase [Chloroflexi bacterium]|nr:phosphatidylinositol kinase [Chloroflexota bacterium]